MRNVTPLFGFITDRRNHVIERLANRYYTFTTFTVTNLTVTFVNFLHDHDNLIQVNLNRPNRDNFGNC